MAPFNASDLHLAQSATGNGSVRANATNRELYPLQHLSKLYNNAYAAHDAFGQEVSWQSAYWPVMACMLAVLLQETGRVMNGPFSWSYALRASPLACAFDTSMMLLKFVVMLVVGCSPRTAARHVWYDRFDQDQDDLITSYVMEIVGGFVENVGDLHFPSFFHDSDEDLPFMGDGTRRSASVAADATIEPVSFADLHAEPDSDEEYMCSGALPTVSDQEPVFSDVPLATLSSPGALSIRQPTRTSTLPGMDVAEVGIGVTEELERHDEEILTALSDDASSTFAGQGQTIVEDTATIAASPPSPNAFMVPANYMKPPPGSTVDRGWRLSIMSFVFGALPQAIKVFAMKGVSGTEALVAIFLVSFVLSEVFRSLAGPVGQVNLYPLPRVLNAKSFLCHVLFFLIFGLIVSILAGGFFFSSFVVFAGLKPLVALVPFGMMLALPVTLLPFGVLRCLIALCPNGIRSYMYDFKMFQFLRTNLVACIAGSLALSPSPVERYIVFVCLYIPCFIGVVWSLSGASIFWIQGGDVIFLVAFLSSLFALLILYITYRLLFMGYLSNITHRLCGTEGTTEEFLKGMFILINFVGITMSYATTWNSSETFKPRWVEVLG